MKSQKIQSVVVFAQVPPPEHGQSRMVSIALQALRSQSADFEVHHINAKFSNSLEEIGESSLGKLLLTAKYLAQAIRLRFRVRDPLFYYVPGPVKWSPVLRDWVLLSVIRVFYGRVVFHWHAIGQGEWANGSERLVLGGPAWIDRLARGISRLLLSRPHASIAVSETSQKDSIAIGASKLLVMPNGIEDPCPDFSSVLLPLRIRQREIIRQATSPTFTMLFLSHGTREKGIIDALQALAYVLGESSPDWRFRMTFAGGVSAGVRAEFEALVREMMDRWPERLSIHEEGYVSGKEKRDCFKRNEIFIAPSRWESFGLTVSEAMAYGMQVVAAASDGVAGVLPNGYEYMAPVSAPELLGRVILRCCEDFRSLSEVPGCSQLRQRFVENYQVKDFSKHFIDGLKGLRVMESRAPLVVATYLADQNPGHDRSFGISRMSQVMLETLQAGGGVRLRTIASETSQQAPAGVGDARILPWGTRRKCVRLLTDHFYPLFAKRGGEADLHYFPKGYLPLLSGLCRPSVVTIHDTIIQYDEDRYPEWRSGWEYAYWAWMLKHTLRRADLVLTVSESAKGQIQAFMDRHGIARKEITVTFEPCVYEALPQPVEPAKENYVIHLASCEPHKRTAHLIRWWREAEARGGDLPMLHLIGSVPPEVHGLLASSHSIVKQPFLEESALQAAYRAARALILPSEIEGFGLPALEAYYLGTPVCFVRGTSVEEVLGVATDKGGFRLEDPGSLESALAEVMAMPAAEVRDCGLKLRETYAAEKVAAKMVAAFGEARKR